MSIYRDYEEEDVYKLFEQEDFDSWQGVIKWLEEEGEKEPEWPTSKLEDLIYDFTTVRDNNTNFTKDPHEVFNLLLENRLN